MKIEDLVLLSLFMRSIMVQNCPRPIAQASGELYFQTDSEWAQCTRKYIICTMKMMVYVSVSVCECVGGGMLRPPHSSNSSCSEDKISCEWRFSGSKEHIEEMKIADSVLLSLFMCSNVMGQHCPSISFSGTQFSNWLGIIPNTQHWFSIQFWRWIRANSMPDKFFALAGLVLRPF